MPTPLILKANGVTIPVMLNDTVAAKEFKQRLPYSVSGYRSAVDYCCMVARGIFDPIETQTGWKNGDISLAGGRLAILFDGEETSQNHRGIMIIAHIEGEHLRLVKALPKTVKFVIETID